MSNIYSLQVLVNLKRISGGESSVFYANSPGDILGTREGESLLSNLLMEHTHTHTHYIANNLF
jgi:hypothetical protein